MNEGFQDELDSLIRKHIKDEKYGVVDRLKYWEICEAMKHTVIELFMQFYKHEKVNVDDFREATDNFIMNLQSYCLNVQEFIMNQYNKE